MPYGLAIPRSPVPSIRKARLWGSLLGLLFILSTVGSATGQVPLELLLRVDGPGQFPHEGDPLPAGTSVLVLHYPAEQPHTLDAAGLPREELGRLLLNRLRSRSQETQVTQEGTTSRPFPTTSASGEITYVLARTPSDSLYETYVNTGDGFVPGFDAVHSGRMTMGPVPSEPARRYRAVYRVYRDERAEATASGATSESTGGSVSRADSPSDTAENTASSPPTAEAESSPESKSTTGAFWALLLGVLFGGLVGGGAVWYVLSNRLREAESERKAAQRRLRKRKDEEFREATGSTPGPADPSEPKNSGVQLPLDLDRLRNENRELRERNETLQREIQQIKDYLEKLRDEES